MNVPSLVRSVAILCYVQLSVWQKCWKTARNVYHIFLTMQLPVLVSLECGMDELFWYAVGEKLLQCIVNGYVNTVYLYGINCVGCCWNVNVISGVCTESVSSSEAVSRPQNAVLRHGSVSLLHFMWSGSNRLSHCRLFLQGLLFLLREIVDELNESLDMSYVYQNEPRLYLLRWRRGVAVERRTRDQEVAGSSLGRALWRKNYGQVSHTYVSPWWVTVITGKPSL